METAADRESTRRDRWKGFVSWTVFLTAVVVSSADALRIKRIFEQLDINFLPGPTALLLGFSSFVWSPLGVLVGLLLLAAGGFVFWKGLLDGRPGAAVLVPFVAAILYVISSWYFTRMPIWRIREALERGIQNR